jgi:hypothetical protein
VLLQLAEWRLDGVLAEEDDRYNIQYPMGSEGNLPNINEEATVAKKHSPSIVPDKI